MIKKTATAIIYLLAVLIIFNLEKGKQSLIKVGVENEVNLAEEKTLIDLEFEKLDERKNSLSEEEYELEQKKLSERLVKALSDYPRFYLSLNSYNSNLVLQCMLIAIMIGYPFSQNQQKNKT